MFSRTYSRVFDPISFDPRNNMLPQKYSTALAPISFDSTNNMLPPNSHHIEITDINYDIYKGFWTNRYIFNNCIILRNDKGQVIDYIPLINISTIVFKNHNEIISGGKRRKSRNNKKSARKTRRCL